MIFGTAEKNSGTLFNPYYLLMLRTLTLKALNLNSRRQRLRYTMKNFQTNPEWG